MSMIGQTKIHRYWRGKAPDWADEAEEDADLRTFSSNRKRKFIDDIHSADDPRLRRLADSRTVDRDEIRADHRRIRQAEIVSKAEDDAAMEEEEEEDEDAVEEKRRRIRERLLKLRREEDEDAVSSVEDEEESEYETDSEEEDEEEEAVRRAMAKPVYVLKHERETIAERERLEAVMQALVEAEKWKIAERKPETKQIVVEMIREDYEIQESLIENEADVGNVDTDDETNEAEEYESWKAREIARIKRDRVRRNMTEEERKKPESGPPKKKWKFLQTYHHKGAYFQSDPDGGGGGSMGSYAIYWRDLSAPTGDDKLNKSILPKVMQVKNFGRSGRTKWTHLVNEDTTDWSSPWANNDLLRSKYNAKMAGMNRPIAKPKGSKKLKTGSSLEFWQVK